MVTAVVMGAVRRRGEERERSSGEHTSKERREEHDRRCKRQWVVNEREGREGTRDGSRTRGGWGGAKRKKRGSTQTHARGPISVSSHRRLATKPTANKQGRATRAAARRLQVVLYLFVCRHPAREMKSSHTLSGRFARRREPGGNKAFLCNR